MKTGKFKPTLRTLRARRVKTKNGFKTELYNRVGELVSTYPDHFEQPHRNKRTIMHNCFKYKLEWVEDAPKPIYVLYGEDACRILGDEGLETLIQNISDENLSHGLGRYEPNDVVKALEESDGWLDYAILSEEDYNKIAEL